MIDRVTATDPLELLEGVLARRRPDLVVLRRVVRPAAAGQTARASRGPTRGQARASWQRTSRGLYVPGDVDRSVPAQRVVEAAALLAGHSGAVTGWAALAWSGARWSTGRHADGSHRPVPLAVSTFDRRPQPGFAISAERLAPPTIEVVDGVRVTTAARSVAFEMRYAPSLVAALVVADMAAYDDLVSTEELAAYASQLNGWTGVGRLRDALALMDENSWSPQESEARYVWSVNAGLPRPLCNHPVFDLDGRHLGTPDLVDPEAGVVGEYDGGDHLTVARRRSDLRREHAFRSVGLEHVVLVAGMSVEERAGRLRAAYARAQGRDARARRWSTEPPRWWTSTTTVAARRTLVGAERDRLLAYRRAAA